MRDERIAQHGVAQMPDVRRFVGIDIGVLDDDLAAGNGGGCLRAGQQRGGISAAIEADIDVAVARDFHRGHARNLADCLDKICGDFLRRLLQSLRELKRDGDGDLPEGSLVRLLKREIGIDAELRAQAVAKCRVNLLLKGMEHGNLEYSDGSASCWCRRKSG